jgi:hypothetical protein
MRNHLAIAILLAGGVACSAADGAACSEGFEMHGDGLCYELGGQDLGVVGDTDADADTGNGTEDFAPSAEDVMETLEDCLAGFTDGRIDVAEGCADGACSGMSYDQVNAALGDAGSCDAIFAGFLSCDWPNGISSYFDDYDGDERPDDGATAYGIHLRDPYDGGTSDGISIGASMVCFFDVYGAPDRADFTWIGEEWWVTSVEYTSLGLYADDWWSKDGYEPDGYCDAISLYGSY